MHLRIYNSTSGVIFSLMRRNIDLLLVMLQVVQIKSRSQRLYFILNLATLSVQSIRLFI